MNRHALVHAMFVLAALVSVYAGLHTAHTVWQVVTLKEGFDRTGGIIDEVIKHPDPAYNGVGKPTFLAEVRFSYAVKGARFVSKTLGRHCTLCTPREVFDVTGSRPGLLAPGTRLPVFVKRGAPSVAYLTPPEQYNVVVQGALVIVLMLIAPVCLYFIYCLWAHAGIGTRSSD